MVKADTSVKWFHSGQSDAPVVNGLAGSLIDMLDACLIDGFSPRAPDGVVVASGVATVSISAGNPYERHAVIEISGASDVALDGEWRIDTAAASSFTFVCPGVADGTVTGASVKRASAGWGKPFGSTNKAVYQSLDPTSTQLYLRVDDTFGRYAQIRGYEQMTDIDTGAGLFPTAAQFAAGLSWAKSLAADATPRTWAFFADTAMSYFYQATYGLTRPGLGAFGDLVSFVENDRYHCVIAGSPIANNTLYPNNGCCMPSQGDGGGCYIARGVDQIINSKQWLRYSVQQPASVGAPFGMGNGDAPSGGYLLRAPVLVSDGVGRSDVRRGVLPGVIEPLHVAFNNINTVPFDGQGGFAGRMLAGYRIVSSNDGSVCIDLTGPWR